MSKIYFVMNNRENTGEGYREVSEEELRNYIAIVNVINIFTKKNIKKPTEC